LPEEWGKAWLEANPRLIAQPFGGGGGGVFLRGLPAGSRPARGDRSANGMHAAAAMNICNRRWMAAGSHYPPRARKSPPVHA